MLRTSFRTRAVAAITALAIAGGGSLLLAPPASAALPLTAATTAQKFVPADSASDVTLNPLTLTEAAVGDITTGNIFLELNVLGTTKWGTALPTVSENNTTLTLGIPVRVDDHTIQIPVTAASTVTPATVTVSGLSVDPDPAARGPITVAAGKTDGASDYATALRVGVVGASDRFGGSNRFATAQVISAQFGCLPNQTVILARGDNFPDALAASYLAGKNAGPILLTGATSFPPETQAALKALGTKSVQIIGGTGAISQGVEDFVANLPAFDCQGSQLAQKLSVARIAGADRYATAKSVALQGGTAGSTDTSLTGGTCEPLKTAIVASGENFPDALAAGPLAFAGSKGCGNATGPIPLVLTQQSALPGATSDVLSNMGIKQVILMGGTGAVSPAVSASITALGINVVRVAGTSRQGTAAQFAAVLGNPEVMKFTGKAVLVSRPDNYPDALAASPYAGGVQAPIYLSDSTSSLGSTTSTGIKAYGGSAVTFDQGILLGGTGALTDAVKTDLEQAIADQT